MLKIFNTFTKKKELFLPLSKKKINIYVCGVTTYDICHIGHARTFLIFDIIVRYLQHLGYRTNYVRNITDIDDKIINTARKNQEPAFILSQRMIKYMNKDFLRLNLILPNEEPRVTECMQEIIKNVDLLLKNKHAYISDNRDILFSILRYKNYGLLSHRKYRNFSHYDSFSAGKDYRLSDDFVLWKYNNNIKNNSDSLWNSPWGFGRPGWHIECSSIINKYFHNTVDIHGGGIDLLFPHHENEIAQSTCMNRNFSVQFWIHVGMVVLDKQKMSKSLLNTISIRNLLEKYDSEVIRYYFLSSHYRHPLEYSEKNLIKSQNILIKIYMSLLGCSINLSYRSLRRIQVRDDFKNQFFQAMNNDFNTPVACSVLRKLSKYINKIKKNNFYLANILASDLIFLGNILGLFTHKPKEFLFKLDQVFIKHSYIIRNLIKMRNNYRFEKKWHLSDIIRIKLLELGIIVEDHLNKSVYRYR
ncbi:cysteine--tRNA ligase [Buchnera aphidicola]|uniref:Cysteine--tRNA ligase n=1 Tax=Buchnera aphidicola (Cinara strobi) TaxID=1921549 RepID=A0A3B1E3X2_9GAMM|nr:cysteine--tRNA ligase [Buchnera aphidicola]VAX76762.1 Cysteine--tRNA ligase [Buchnera aphidicola (Cinara strobi)]